MNKDIILIEYVNLIVYSKTLSHVIDTKTIELLTLIATTKIFRKKKQHSRLQYCIK